MTDRDIIMSNQEKKVYTRRYIDGVSKTANPKIFLTETNFEERERDREIQRASAGLQMWL